MTPVLKAYLLAAVFLTAFAGTQLAAMEQINEFEGVSDETRRLNFTYRRVPMERVLDYLSRVSGRNIILMVEDEDDQEELLRQNVDMELEGVTWRTALQVLANRYKYEVNNQMEKDGVVVLEKPSRITMTVKDSEISRIIQMIARQAGVNIIIGPEVKGKMDLSIRDVPWRDALESILKAHGFLKVEDRSGIIRITTPEKVKQQLQTRVFALRYVTPQASPFVATVQSEYISRTSASSAAGERFSLLNVLENIKSPDGRVTFEQRTNRIVVTDTATKLTEIQRVIDQIDIPPLQVLINTRIMTMTQEGESETGVDWVNGFIAAAENGVSWQTVFPFSVKRKSSPGSFGHLGALGAAAQGPAGPVPLDKAWEYHYSPGDPTGSVATSLVDYSSTYSLGTLSFASLQAILQLVRTNKSINLVQAPQIVAMDNEEATIHVGRVIRYAEFYSETTDGGTVSGYRAADPLVAGVQLVVVPHVTADSEHVIMTVMPKTEDFEGFEVFGAGTANEIRLPQTSAKVVMTKMMLANQETGVIAGLISENTINSERKVPLLGDIPYLGYAFKRKSMNSIKQNVLVLITPQIIKPNARKEFDSTFENIRNSVSMLDMPDNR